jgi:hypothetical protein
MTGPRIGEHVTCQRGQPKRVVKFAIGKQSSVGGDDRATELQRQAAVKIESESARFRFTRWVRHPGLPQSQITS